MIDFNIICIDKSILNQDEKVLILDISEYERTNQVVMPFIATVKFSPRGDILFEEEEEDSLTYDDDYRYIVVAKLNEEKSDE